MSESAPAAVDQAGFRRILTRNIALPAAAGLASAIVFVGLILYLLSSMRWVDHTQEVIGNANEISRLAVDMESGMRGYLLTGDDAFLGAVSHFQTEDCQRHGHPQATSHR